MAVLKGLSIDDDFEGVSREDCFTGVADDGGALEGVLVLEPEGVYAVGLTPTFSKSSPYSFHSSTSSRSYGVSAYCGG